MGRIKAKFFIAFEQRKKFFPTSKAKHYSSLFLFEQELEGLVLSIFKEFLFYFLQDPEVTF